MSNSDEKQLNESSQTDSLVITYITNKLDKIDSTVDEIRDDLTDHKLDLREFSGRIDAVEEDVREIRDNMTPLTSHMNKMLGGIAAVGVLGGLVGIAVGAITIFALFVPK